MTAAVAVTADTVAGSLLFDETLTGQLFCSPITVPQAVAFLTPAG